MTELIKNGEINIWESSIIINKDFQVKDIIVLFYIKYQVFRWIYLTTIETCMSYKLYQRKILHGRVQLEIFKILVVWFTIQFKHW